jgi:hypothetical protein
MVMDKTMQGRPGTRFNPSVPVGLVRPKPVKVPPCISVLDVRVGTAVRVMNDSPRGLQDHYARGRGMETKYAGE